PMTVPAGQLRSLLGTSRVMVKQGGQDLAIIDSTLADA
ncbi:MAG: metallophosphoesterase, partial [Mesorhizobium sp.]